MYRFILSSLAAVLLAGCGKNPSEPAPSNETPSDRRTFQVKGVVIELEADGKTARIKHEEIPGYMAAMTMPLEVRDTNELAGLEPGDSISFRMIVTEDDGWIDQVRKLDVPRVNVAPTSGPFRLVRDVEPLNEGDALPEYRFIDQNGKPISTAQYKGGALAINFIFTRCPFPTFCPLMAKPFAETQNRLLSSPASPTNWHLLSLT
ncbi:MAG TPA: copper-binding protein, partial [Verrucomicrobiota bacterium]|nr:copper-binding protein [Verrucomicrobiota bacterium]